MLHIKTNGTLSLSKGQISSNQQFGFSRLFVDSGGTISLVTHSASMIKHQDHRSTQQRI